MPKNKSFSCKLPRYFVLFCLIFLLVYIFMSGFFFTHGEVDLDLLKSIDFKVEGTSIFSSERSQDVDSTPIIMNKTPISVDVGKSQLRSEELNIQTSNIKLKTIEKSLLHSDEVKIQTRSSTKLETYAVKKKNAGIPSASTFSLDTILLQPDCVGHSEDLVLGIAVNTNDKNFAIFAYSFREVNPKAMAIIFVNEPVPKIHSEIARNASIIIVEFNAGHMKPDFLANFHPSSLRWVLFERLLSASDGYLARTAKKLIVVDVRDTYFQTDPFALISDTTNVFYAFGESRGMNIFSCGWNTGWIRDCFAEEVLNRIGEQPIICSGISIGSMDKMFQYVSSMSMILKGQSTLTSKFPQCERNGVDQGVHNMIIHTKQFSPITVQYPDIFRVINMQSSPEFQPVSDISTELLGTDNSLFSIVHQYDRLMTFQRALAKKYVGWVNIGNPEEEWAAEPICARFHKEINVEIFRGICDMGATRLLSPASCCEACVSKGTITKIENGETVRKTCTGFTYLEGVCYLKGCTFPQLRSAVIDYRQNRRAETFSSPGSTCAYLKEQYLLP